MRSVAILRSQLSPARSLAISTGVRCGVDTARALLAGADIAMMIAPSCATAPERFAVVERELLEWMDACEHE